MGGKKITMKLKEYFKKCIMHFSLEERKRQKYRENEKKIEELRKLSEMELKSEYINLKSKYERNKGVLTLFLITVILVVLNDIWCLFQRFIQQMLNYTSLIENKPEYAIISFMNTLIITVFLIIIIMMIAGNYIRNLYKVYEQLLRVEMVREERK